MQVIALRQWPIVVQGDARFGDDKLTVTGDGRPGHGERRRSPGRKVRGIGGFTFLNPDFQHTLIAVSFLHLSIGNKSGNLSGAHRRPTSAGPKSLA